MALPRKTIMIGALTTLILAISTVSVTFIVLEVIDDNRPIDYVKSDPIVIWGDDDFDYYDFPGSGTINDPYIIEKFNITTYYKTGINIWNTTKYFIVQNCYVDAFNIGILVESVEPGSAIIRDNLCLYNYRAGIVAYYSPGTTIENNYCAYNEFGIVAESSIGSTLKDNVCKFNKDGIIVYYSPLTSIYNCDAIDNDLGIFIGYSTFTYVENCYLKFNLEGFSLYNSHSTTIEDTIIEDNSYGIILMNSDSSIINNSQILSNMWGIYAEYNSRAIIENNYIAYNSHAIDFSWDVDMSKIRYNLFESNYQYAISFKSSCTSNEIYQNAFIDNAKTKSSQAYDDGLNYWYDYYSNIGNFWNDWSGNGSYVIDGIGGNTDPYPLLLSPLL